VRVTLGSSATIDEPLRLTVLDPCSSCAPDLGP